MLKVKSSNQELAQYFIQRIEANRSGLVGASSKLMPHQGPLVLAIPVLCIFFAVLNAGFLAIAETAVATSTLYDHQKAMASVFFAICIGPIAIAQLISGILYANTRERSFGQVGAMISMIPLTPVALASIPFGVWARKQLQPAPPGGFSSSSPHVGWGLTTVLFSAESKYARVTSIIETAICLVVLCGAAVWVLGLYPITLRYRVVGHAAEQEMSSFLESRLQDVSTTSIRHKDNRLEVTTLRRWRERVMDQLAITEAPSLIICADVTTHNTNVAKKEYVPSLSDKLPDGLSVRTSAAGIEVAVSSEIVLHDELLSAVQSNQDDSLTVTWSREGFTQIRDLLTEQESKPTLALKIDGWIEAITADKSNDTRPPKSASFRWLLKSKRSIRSLQAALRGPSLKAEFELIE